MLKQSVRLFCVAVLLFLIPPAAGTQDLREDQTALQGTNLAYYPQPEFGQCQADCAANGNCRGFTWIQAGTYNPGDSAMCYLMASVTGRSPARGHFSVAKGTGSGGSEDSGWGVWASAAGGQWSDPCAIQYAAARIAGNRYDGNPGYRRVRSRATQPEADLDIDHFGRYHRDQPDGVVKMVSCAGSGPADISGAWRGYNNYAYSIQQNGSSFTWTVGELQETASGTINGNSVTASWRNPRWTGSGTGTVERDANGRAMRIRWSNGVVFER